MIATEDLNDDVPGAPAAWRFRSIWTSDLHRGTPGCRADALLNLRAGFGLVGDVDDAVACESRRRGLRSIVSGPIHHPELREVDGLLYADDGDWVEHLTALVEHADSRLEIVAWAAADKAVREPVGHRGHGTVTQAS